MKVPDGFSVEVVAAEPDIVNPVAMTFDERGRIWVTESLEYPRRPAGPGRDRVKVLEDTDGDGKVDKVTVFADGLNIPSGIAVGHGGVWVANAPDILFYRIGADGKAAGKPEVIVTGFGRDDTHELPNSLTWGPDGWLYGLNGVFNRSVVKSNNGKTYDFTCALFRIHPRTHEFQLFCEGTSNPWGLAIDPEGSFFVSACVIDHLWHLAETGYYHRQGGPYPSHTWVLGSIVKHHHQKAAYCGLHYFDSDAYPPEYRDKLYMGNIHGNCVNSDELTRDGATYFAKPRPDFLSADDAWFMPVSQKTGPDGCLYILDWYDRYHCYQDANRDPKGIDRLRGRLYRVRYKDAPRSPRFDLAKESDQQLLGRLASPNVYFRDQAQRLLSERNTHEVRQSLRKLVLDARTPRKARMHALWALAGIGSLEADLHRELLTSADPTIRAWGVRAAGNMGKVEGSISRQIIQMARAERPEVLLQISVAARKIEGLDPIGTLLDVLCACGNDKLVPAIIWQNLLPLLDRDVQKLLHLAASKQKEVGHSPNVSALLPRVADKLLSVQRPDPKVLGALFHVLIRGPLANEEAARACMAALRARVLNGEITGVTLDGIAATVLPEVRTVMGKKSEGHYFPEDVLLAATLKDPAAFEQVRDEFTRGRQNEKILLKDFEVLIYLKDVSALVAVPGALAGAGDQRDSYRAGILAALGRCDDPIVAQYVVGAFDHMPPELRPRAVELLTQRPVWGKRLLRAVADKRVPAWAINANQARRLLNSKDSELVKLVRDHWGTLREVRNPEREKIVARMGDFLRNRPGDAKAGAVVFKNLCGQCHKIYGEGQDVGPDLTSNGRASFEQLLSNVFDPSLVIGASYQATTVLTKNGRSLTGLVAEDSPARVVLKTQGGKLETIARDQVEEINVSSVSLMPEGVENQLKPKEIVDLFAFLVLDRPPGDPAARKIPGAP